MLFSPAVMIMTTSNMMTTMMVMTSGRLRKNCMPLLKYGIYAQAYYNINEADMKHAPPILQFGKQLFDTEKV